MAWDFVVVTTWFQRSGMSPGCRNQKRCTAVSFHHNPEDLVPFDANETFSFFSASAERAPDRHPALMRMRSDRVMTKGSGQPRTSDIKRAGITSIGHDPVGERPLAGVETTMHRIRHRNVIRWWRSRWRDPARRRSRSAGRVPGSGRLPGRPGKTHVWLPLVRALRDPHRRANLAWWRA